MFFSVAFPFTIAALLILTLIFQFLSSRLVGKLAAIAGCFLIAGFLAVGFWLLGLVLRNTLPPDEAIIRQFQTWTPLFDEVGAILSRQKKPAFGCSENGSTRKNPVQSPELETLASGFRDVYAMPLRIGDCASLAIFFERKATQNHSFYEPESKGIAFLPHGWKAADYRYLVENTDYPAGIEGLDTEAFVIYFRHLEGNWYIYLQHQSW